MWRHDSRKSSRDTCGGEGEGSGGRGAVGEGGGRQNVRGDVTGKYYWTQMWAWKWGTQKMCMVSIIIHRIIYRTTKLRAALVTEDAI